MTTNNKLITRHLSLITIFQDIRFGLRILLKAPGFTCITVLILAVGIGANTAIFSCLHAFLFRPLPYNNPERLVWLQEKHATFGNMSTCFPNYLDWQKRNKTFEQMASFRDEGKNMTAGDSPNRVRERQVTASLFPMLGVKPIRGRLFQESDDCRDAVPTVILSYSFWKNQYEENPDIIGKTALLDGIPYTVIGVLPREFSFPFNESLCDIWTPIRLYDKYDWFLERGNHPGISTIAKLKPGITADQAQADIKSIALQLQQEYPAQNVGCTVEVTDYQTILTRHLKPSLWLLMAAVVFVLLIASANISNLLLARSSARMQEFAIRNALGASRFRIVRQVLCESLVLVFIGGACGLLFAVWGLELIIRAIPMGDFTDPKTFFQINSTVLWFSLIITAVTGILFGLFPAIQSSRVNLSEAMNDSNRSSTAGRKRNRFREALAISEIALALVLLVGAGLMIRSFYQYINADPGYNPRNAMLMSISLTEKDYPNEPQVTAFYKNILQQVKAIPGIQFASISSSPLGNWQSSFYAEGAPIPQDNSQTPYAEYNIASREHFEAMGIKLLQGRYFSEQDVQESKPVVIVDERFAKKWWPNENPVGKRLQAHTCRPEDKRDWLEIVGVTAHIKHYGVDNQSIESIYLPAEQWLKKDVRREMELIVRTKGEPMLLASAIRKEVSALDKNVPVSNVRTLTDINMNRSFMRRFTAILLSLFALTALFLAALGIYAVMAYSVIQRYHEIGIRMAMGANLYQILLMVMKKGLYMTLTGLFFGLIGSLLMSRVLSSMLYGIGSIDPFTYAAVSLLLILITLISTYLPARKAAKVDPMVALRWE